MHAVRKHNVTKTYNYAKEEEENELWKKNVYKEPWRQFENNNKMVSWKFSRTIKCMDQYLCTHTHTHTHTHTYISIQYTKYELSQTNNCFIRNENETLQQKQKQLRPQWERKGNTHSNFCFTVDRNCSEHSPAESAPSVSSLPGTVSGVNRGPVNQNLGLVNQYG